MLPFWRRSLSTLTGRYTFPRARPFLSRPTFGTAFKSSLSSTEKTSLEPADQRSLIAVPVYETSPASFGFESCSGYESMIKPGTPLPSTRSMMLGAIIDYATDSSFPVCGCLPTTRLRGDFAQLNISGIREEIKEKNRVKATMTLRKDLTGRFTVRYRSQKGFTKAEASIEFNGSQIWSRGDVNALVSLQSGQGSPAFLVVERQSNPWIEWGCRDGEIGARPLRERLYYLPPIYWKIQTGGKIKPEVGLQVLPYFMPQPLS